MGRKATSQVALPTTNDDEQDGNLCNEHPGLGPVAKREQRLSNSAYHPIENHKREAGGVPSLEAH
jgi:hypothetical protein